MTYVLQIVFKSNERPFSTRYQPVAWHHPHSDESAIKWAEGVAAGLGSDYICTLFRDGTVIKVLDSTT